MSDVISFPGDNPKFNFDGELCPICQKGHLHKVTVNETFTYRGISRTFFCLGQYGCDSCSESIVTAEDGIDYEKELKKFFKEVNESNPPELGKKLFPFKDINPDDDDHPVYVPSVPKEK